MFKFFANYDQKGNSKYSAFTLFRKFTAIQHLKGNFNEQLNYFKQNKVSFFLTEGVCSLLVFIKLFPNSMKFSNPFFNLLNPSQLPHQPFSHRDESFPLESGEH